MKKRLALFLVVSMVALTSCERTDSDAALIECSGSFAFSSSSINGYENIKTSRTAASLIGEAEAGIPTYVLFARESCYWCRNFEPSFIGAMKKTKKYVHVFYYSEDDLDGKDFYDENLLELKSKYGNDINNGGIDGATPRLYRLYESSAKMLDIYNDASSSDKFASFMNYETKQTSFYRFSDMATFELAVNSNQSVRLCLYDSSDPSSQTLYSKEFKSSYDKETYVLDYGCLTPTEKTGALSKFNLQTYEFTIS